MYPKVIGVVWKALILPCKHNHTWARWHHEYQQVRKGSNDLPVWMAFSWHCRIAIILQTSYLCTLSCPALGSSWHRASQRRMTAVRAFTCMCVFNPSVNNTFQCTIIIGIGYACKHCAVAAMFRIPELFQNMDDKNCVILFAVFMFTVVHGYTSMRLQDNIGAGIPGTNIINRVGL